MRIGSEKPSVASTFRRGCSRRLFLSDGGTLHARCREHACTATAVRHLNGDIEDYDIESLSEYIQELYDFGKCKQHNMMIRCGAFRIYEVLYGGVRKEENKI